MVEFLNMRQKEALSDCVQSILVNTGGHVTSAADIQSVFDAVLAAARSTNAKYAYGWNIRQRTKGVGRLPDELLVHCLAFLELADWIRATLVSHHWHSLVETPSLWSKVTVRYPHKLTLASDDTKVSWLRSYLAKSADASLDIQWCPHSIKTLELELISANMHRTAHFETPHPMDMAFPSSMLGQRALRLETFCFCPDPGLVRNYEAFDFEAAFGAKPHVDLRKLHVGTFTLPAGSQCLPTVTDFEGVLQANDASNLQLFSILPNLSAATLWFQSQPVIPAGTFPITLQTVRFKDVSASTTAATARWEPLLASAIHPMRTISFDSIDNLEVPFELFKKAVPDKWELVAGREKGIFSHMLLTRFTMTPATGSTTDTICHSFRAMDHRWKSFVCSPSGAASVARNSFLVSLQLTTATFCALLKATADLPALLVFTLFTSDGSDLPSKYDILSDTHSLAPIRANNLREFIVKIESFSCEPAARWFTKFLPHHIHDLFKYEQPRLERLAFAAQTLKEVHLADYAWGGVARLANKVHVGPSLDSSPLLVPSEADDIADGSDWESEADVYLDDGDDYRDYYDDDTDDPYNGYSGDDFDDYGDTGYDWQ